MKTCKNKKLQYLIRIENSIRNNAFNKPWSRNLLKNAIHLTDMAFSNRNNLNNIKVALPKFEGHSILLLFHIHTL